MKLNGRKRRPADYIHVRNVGGCSSSVGRVGGRQTLQLESWCLKTHKTWSGQGTVMHEFMHAIGKNRFIFNLKNVNQALKK